MKSSSYYSTVFGVRMIMRMIMSLIVLSSMHADNRLMGMGSHVQTRRINTKDHCSTLQLPRNCMLD